MLVNIFSITLRSGNENIFIPIATSFGENYTRVVMRIKYVSYGNRAQGFTANGRLKRTRNDLIPQKSSRSSVYISVPVVGRGNIPT